MDREIVYKFKWFDHCEMCGDPVGRHKVMGMRLNQSQGFRHRRKKGVAVTICRCRKCGLIYSNPMPVPENINDHYGIDPNDYWPDHYFDVKEGYMNEELFVLKQLMPIKPGMKALDIGAGIGKALIALKKNGFDAYGLEPSETFHNYAISKMGIDADRILCSSVEEADFKPDYFDFISLFNVVEHVYDPFNTIKKALYWLKPGGFIHIEVPNAKCLVPRIINTFYRFSGSAYVSNISPMHSPFHLYEFSKKSFQLSVKKMKGEIVRFDMITGNAVNIPFANSFLLRNIMKVTGTGVDLIVWITKQAK